MSACWLESRETSETKKGGSDTVRETNYAGNEYISYDVGPLGSQMNKKARPKHMKHFDNPKSSYSRARGKLHKPIARNTSLHTTGCCSIRNTAERDNPTKTYETHRQPQIQMLTSSWGTTLQSIQIPQHDWNQSSLSSVSSTGFSLSVMRSSRSDTVWMPLGWWGSVWSSKRKSVRLNSQQNWFVQFVSISWQWTLHRTSVRNDWIENSEK